MIHPLHKEILNIFREISGKPTRDEFLNSYLGNDHPRYAIKIPELRSIAKECLRSNRHLTAREFADVITSLVEGQSCTEKMMAGIMLGYSSKDQRTFDPMIFDRWLDHLVGWAEVDTLCTGNFLASQVPLDWPKWKKLIAKLSKDKNINKRRASLALFCSPLGKVRDERIAEEALRTVERLKAEKSVLITKAISWVLRSMVKLYKPEVEAYVSENKATLPKIAVRETLVKLETGRKTNRV